MESLTTGTLAGTGSFRCEECGYVVTLAAADSLPDCPGCGGSRFARASLFSGGRFQRRPGDEPTIEEREALVARARSMIGEPGQYLAWYTAAASASRRSSASGPASGGALRPTCASTTRPCRAATR